MRASFLGPEAGWCLQQHDCFFMFGWAEWLGHDRMHSGCLAGQGHWCCGASWLISLC